MLDEDYGYGYKENKICHWTLTGIGIVFLADDDRNNTRFTASISGRDLDKKSFEFNHLKIDYPQENKITNYLSTGELNKSLFKQEEYFTFYATFEEVK